jgi:hypothetical protein
MLVTAYSPLGGPGPGLLRDATLGRIGAARLLAKLDQVMKPPSRPIGRKEVSFVVGHPQLLIDDAVCHQRLAAMRTSVSRMLMIAASSSPIFFARDSRKTELASVKPGLYWDLCLHVWPGSKLESHRKRP